MNGVIPTVDRSGATIAANAVREQQRLLAAEFGPIKFRLARTRQQIDRDISMGRVGRELYPPLILILALVLGLEMLVANRFYRE